MASSLTLLLVAFFGVIAVDGGVVAPPDTRIVGGDTIDFNKVPWQVFLRMRGDNICGGSIISPRWVLTAAHCTNGFHHTEVKVLAGSASMFGNTWYDVEQVKQHESYNRGKRLNDICLLKTTKKIVHGKPVALPGPGARRPGLNQPLLVTGWGRMENGQHPELLRGVQVRVQTFEQCAAIRDSDESTQICIGMPGQNFCKGDSGGPVVKDNVLVGIVSYFREGSPCGAFHAAVSDVSVYRDWIRRHAKV